jgi:Carboxypeptidase regulatory-like domain
MHRTLIRSCLVGVVIVANAAGGFAQGGSTSSLSGVVVDPGGGIVPGATVLVKNSATGTTSETVTNADGVFSVPALEIGAYTVTVSLTGFKTAVVNDVKVVPGAPASIKAVLTVGNLEERIEVSSSSDIINTQTATISAVLNVDQINKMPMATRNALNAVTFLPGVNTANINRNSTVNGLPESFIAITLDGVSNADNFNKSSDGFFASVTPRQDAVEAVSVTTAVGGADIGGNGAVQVAIVTRSGTNRFTGSGYEYFRHPSLNSNYFFNEVSHLPKNDVTLNQYGFRQGGPIVIPKLYDGHGKAFFFFNYEELRLPNNATRTRNVLNPSAQAGRFRYTVGTEVREVNLLELAARTNNTTTLDPTVQRVLGYINAATATGGALEQQPDPNLMDYKWQSPGNQTEWQPVVRIDYNLTDKHRLTGSTNWVWVIRDPDHLNSADARFPTAPNYRRYESTRPLTALSLRSTLTTNIVNELRGGFTTGGTSYFGVNSSNGPTTFTDTDGYALDLVTSNNNANGLNLTNWHQENNPSWRWAGSWNLDDTLSWQKGKHSLSFGTSLYFGNAWENAQNMVSGITFGVDTNDPANAMFIDANFRGASSGQLTDARELYGLLTGRVTSYSGQAALDEDTGTYVYLGQRRRAGQMNEYSLFTQDSWRITPGLTINGGVRWDVQMPFVPVNDIMSQSTYADVCGISGVGADGRCNFFQPNASGGKVPTYIQFTTGTRGYTTDWNNVAPNIGVAWRPNVESGWLRRLLGDPEQATVRAGYSVAYDRQGMGVFTGQYGANPGTTLSLTRSGDNGLLVPAGQRWPVLFSDRSRLAPPGPCPEGVVNAGCIPDAPTYPIPVRSNRADNIEAFHPEIEIARARTWTVSFQRALTRNTAVDIRYVGTRGVNQWTEVNYQGANERNLVENGFLNEFRFAMANLQANNASGVSNRVGSFAYFGPGSGTTPLPIYLAYFNGSTQSGSPAAYAGTDWINTAFASRLVRTNPDPQGSAGDLDGNSTRRARALQAGLPATFFVLNPDVNQVNVYESAAFSDYHALQVELRRRLSRGLQINGSYQYALEGGSSLLGLRYGRVMNPAANVRHAIKTQWDYSIPVGRGRRFGTDMNKWMNGLVGGWEFSGAGRIQARTVNIQGPGNSNVRLVGMTVDELTDAFTIRYDTDPETGLRRVWIMPEDIILNTRRAFSTSATSATGYSDLGVPEGRYIAPANSGDCIELKDGDCAPRTLLVRAPLFTRFDIGLTKRFPIHGQMNFELRLDMLNVFDNVNFDPGTTTGSLGISSAANIFQVTTAYTDFNNTFDPGGRLGQLVFRVNW